MGEEKINNPKEKYMKDLTSYFRYKKTRMANAYEKMLKLTTREMQTEL